MDVKTIKKLNDLNAKFYQAIAESFSDSRKHSWKGWDKLILHIKMVIKNKQNLKVLDLGCGNGRFAEFLISKFPNTKFNYLGIDNNINLLKIAKKKLAENNLNLKTDFKQIDLLENNLASEKYDLIVAFGLMHHIASFDLRIQFLKDIKSKLNSGGLLIITCWQFGKSKRLISKQIDPNLININKNNLETNDYILDWQRGKTAYRYCHNFTDSEIEELIKESNLKLVTSFDADGKENLNKYLVLSS